MKTEPLYGEGDWIVHSRYGVGRVQGKDTKKLNGKERTFLRVKTNNGEFWLPVNKTDVDHIRPVALKSTFENILSTIRNVPDELADDYRSRQRYLSEVLDRGELEEISRLIRDLNARQYYKKLTMNEQEVLGRLKKRFVDEWIISAEIDSQDASRRLEEALLMSAKKLNIEN